jgi:uncharacterized membrane protein
MESPYIYNFLNDDELLRISDKIKETERRTSGEICVSIREQRSLSERKKDVKEIAEAEFFKRNIDKTRDKTGILIFLLLKDKKFYILADSGINEKVEQNTWDDVKENMQQMFLNGKFCKGILTGIEQVGNILEKYFPIKPDDTNEISNKVLF